MYHSCMFIDTRAYVFIFDAINSRYRNISLELSETERYTPRGKKTANTITKNKTQNTTEHSKYTGNTSWLRLIINCQEAIEHSSDAIHNIRRRWRATNGTLLKIDPRNNINFVVVVFFCWTKLFFCFVSITWFEEKCAAKTQTPNRVLFASFLYKKRNGH